MFNESIDSYLQLAMFLFVSSLRLRRMTSSISLSVQFVKDFLASL